MDNLYVIKLDNGEYWCGPNCTDKQIRKANMYTSIKHCKEVAEDLFMSKKLLMDKIGATSYKIIIIRIEIIGEA